MALKLRLDLVQLMAVREVGPGLPGAHAPPVPQKDSDCPLTGPASLLRQVQQAAPAVIGPLLDSEVMAHLLGFCSHCLRNSALFGQCSGRATRAVAWPCLPAVAAD